MSQKSKAAQKKDARFIAKNFNNAALIFFIPAIFIPGGFLYVPIVILSVIFPLLATIIVAGYKDFISLDSQNKKNPSVDWGFAPICILVLKTIENIHYIHTPLIVIYTLSVSLALGVASRQVFTAIMNAPYKMRGQKIAAIIIFFLALPAFSFGLIMNVNALFDRSTPTFHRATVLRKIDSDGQHSHTYYLSVSAWADQAEKSQVTVSYPVFNNINVGDTVEIGVKRGFLNIRFYQAFIPKPEPTFKHMLMDPAQGLPPQFNEKSLLRSSF